MSMIISGYGGYVLKYVGDAVIGIFPADFDQQKACINSINCAKTMLKITTDVINPVFANKLPLIEINSYGVSDKVKFVDPTRSTQRTTSLVLLLICRFKYC